MHLSETNPANGMLVRIHNLNFITKMTLLVDETRTLDSLFFYAFLNQKPWFRFHSAEPHSSVYSEMRSH